MEHIHTRLEDRIQPYAIDHMKTIRANTMYEMEMQMSPDPSFFGKVLFVPRKNNMVDVDALSYSL